MEWIRQSEPTVGETWLFGTHPSGLTVYLNEKERSQAYAVLGVRYGGSDYRYIDENGKTVEHPAGMAHFLEHKMFENADGTDSMLTFSRLGLDSNAYTSRDMTAYLFSGSGDLYGGLKELVTFVTHPYYTAKTVKKEMGIIGEEISTSLNTPSDKLCQTVWQNVMTEGNPLRDEILGTVESIGKITPKMLYEAHGLFYVPSNMVLVLSGRFDADAVAKVLDETLPSTYVPRRFVRLWNEDVETVAVKKETVSLGIRGQKVRVIYKGPSGEDVLRRRRFMGACDLVMHYFNNANPDYDALQRAGVIQSDFGIWAGEVKHQTYLALHTTTCDPDEAVKALRTMFVKLRETVDEDYVRTSVKKTVALELFGTELCEGWCDAVLDDVLADDKPFGLTANLKNVTPDDIRDAIDLILDESRCAVAVGKE